MSKNKETTKWTAPAPSVDSAALLTGTIKRVIHEKGFGFVQSSDGMEWFFHRSGCTGVAFEDLKEGDKVEFRPGTGQKGPRAESLTRAKD